MSLKGKKLTKKEASAKKISAVVAARVGNYEKHPFFVKKNTAAKALITKVGLPKELTNKEEV
jgi:hypothetical protein